MAVALGVAYRRKVIIQNTRLAVIHHLLQAAMIVLLIIPWLSTEGWYSTTEPRGDIGVFPSGSNDEEVAIKANERDAQASFCTHPSKFEYCDSIGCEYHYAPSSCIDICAGNTTEGCISMAERWFLEDRGKGLFFPTYLNETLTWPNTDGMPESKNRQVFIKGLEDLGMMFDHGFIAPSLWGDNAEGSAKIYSGQPENQKPVLTVLKDTNGNILDQIKPGDSLLMLSVKDILKAGGLTLDKVNYRAGTNFAPGGETRDGMFLRLSGVELIMTLSYTNKHPYDWKGPVCEITVRTNEYGSTLDDTSTMHSGGVMSRFYSGVRIGFETKGKFYWIDPIAISSFLSQVLVFMGVATAISEYFATRWLGDISQVYKRMIKQEFNMQSCLIEETMKQMIYSSAFHSMKNAKEGMTQKGMQAALQRTFSDQLELGPTELLRMSHYLFEKMGLHGMEVPLMNVGHFGTVCSELEPIDAPLLARFFDVDVKRSFMERIFADISVRELFGPKSQRPLRHLHSHEEHGELTLQEQLHAQLINMEKTVRDARKSISQDTLELKDSFVKQGHYEFTEADIKKMNDQELKANSEQNAKYEGQRSTGLPPPVPVLEHHPTSDMRLNELARTVGAAHCVAVSSRLDPKTENNGERGGNDARGNENKDVKWDMDSGKIASMSFIDKLVAVIDGLSEKVVQLEARLADKYYAIDPKQVTEQNSVGSVPHELLHGHPMVNAHPMFDAKLEELTRGHGRNVSTTDKIVAVVDGLCGAVAQLEATRWSVSQEILTGMAGLENRMVEIVEQVGLLKNTKPSGHQPAASRPPSIWFDAHIDQLRCEVDELRCDVDAIKNREKLREAATQLNKAMRNREVSSQKDVERQRDDQVQHAADV